MPPEFLSLGPDDGPLAVLLAHGAGVGMESDFMAFFAGGVAGLGYRAVRFEFPYMAARRSTGSKKGPDSESKLLQAWREAAAEFDAARLVIGGKSLGGRIASMVAKEIAPAGLVCLGYPFHAPGRPEKPRIDHLRDLDVPTLILQGSRDPFGNRDEVAGYELAPAIRIHWLEDGDHDFKPRRASGRTPDQNLDEAMDVLGDFLREIHSPKDA